ncbi:MAG: hypothetical protein L3J56_04070 [Bacteroidales bacterium]|nr:hypothetical protein [Bacteroidales bacterium]
MGQHILEIVLMLLGAAILGFFIGWLLKKDKISDLQTYITALEDKNNRLQADYNKNERLLIDCQTEKRKAESEKIQIEKLLIDCEGKLTLSEIESAKKDATPEVPKISTSSENVIKSKTKVKADNLTKIEGIGPKIASVLKNAGIENFKELSETKSEKISEILVKAGGNSYNRFDPATWPNQAKFAVEGKWDELKKLQDILKGGRKE